MLILNDIHLGVNRRTGTTPTTARALKTKLQDQFAAMVEGAEEQHLVVAGDLFDAFEVDYCDLLLAYRTLDKHLAKRGTRLTLIRGNHDASAKGDRISSFEFLAQILLANELYDVLVINGALTQVEGDLWAIGHCDNQDLFNLEMQRAIDTMPVGSNLILHCNYDNGYTEESDHSLNLSQAQAKKLEDAKIDILLAHEHQAREVGNVIVMGNQWPSSVADCMNNDCKYAHWVSEGALTRHVTWMAEDDFVRIDWRDLRNSEIEDTVSFIRVEGDAAQSEAADVVSTVAKFRARRDTLVISNNVRIAGMTDIDDLAALQFEDIKAFDVWTELRALLTSEEQAILDPIYQERLC